MRVFALLFAAILSTGALAAGPDCGAKEATVGDFMLNHAKDEGVTTTWLPIWLARPILEKRSPELARQLRDVQDLAIFTYKRERPESTLPEVLHQELKEILVCNGYMTLVHQEEYGQSVQISRRSSGTKQVEYVVALSDSYDLILVRVKGEIDTTDLLSLLGFGNVG